MTRRERLERKLEQRREWAASRQNKAASLHKANEPFRGDYAFNTQPGHIPERARVLRRTDKAVEHFKPDFCGRIGIAGYVLQNNNANIRRMQQRIQEIEARNERVEAAEAAPGGVRIEEHLECNWCRVIFAEKPERSILSALRKAGYRWGGGMWQGHLNKLPQCVRDLVEGGAA